MGLPGRIKLRPNLALMPYYFFFHILFNRDLTENKVSTLPAMSFAELQALTGL